MTEYAIINAEGEIVNVMSTSRSLEEVQRRFTFAGFTVRPVQDVPLSDLERYRFWNERP